MLEVDLHHVQGDFTLQAAFTAGEGLTALFGPSGSGKSTLIQLIAGLVKPREGHVRFAGETWSDSRTGGFLPPHRRGIGLVFQEHRLFPHRSVRENLLYPTRFRPEARAGRDENLARIAGLLGIAPLLDRRTQALSGGEKQRVALGRALMARPRLLLMDEPLSALDNDLKADILPDLERIRDVEGIPILYVSHSVEEIAQLATRVVTLDRGRITAHADGPAASGNRLSLDLPSLGSFLDATVTAHLPEDELTLARSAAGPLHVRAVDLPVGAEIRVLVPAQEVVLATGAVSGLSTLNRLSGHVLACRDLGSSTEVTVDCSGTPITARITRLSARNLELAPGKPVTVLFKALTIAPESLFRRG
jgi:molybdate transport system ATP-binding protein